MSRTTAKTYSQPNDYTCGPTSLKTALEILGQRKSISNLAKLCHTTSRGTSLKNLVKAANKLGLSALSLEKATLKHLNASLKPHLAVIVNYLYKDEEPFEETGHYATVASYSKTRKKVTLFDPYSGHKRSYAWPDFLDRWYDYDHKRVNLKTSRSKTYKFKKYWQIRPMLILTKNPDHFPKFALSSAKTYLP